LLFGGDLRSFEIRHSRNRVARFAERDVGRKETLSYGQRCVCVRARTSDSVRLIIRWERYALPITFEGGEPVQESVA
jgi:hypothetical protein